jgi:hypothetical protein
VTQHSKHLTVHETLKGMTKMFWNALLDTSLDGIQRVNLLGPLPCSACGVCVPTTPILASAISLLARSRSCCCLSSSYLHTKQTLYIHASVKFTVSKYYIVPRTIINNCPSIGFQRVIICSKCSCVYVNNFSFLSHYTESNHINRDRLQGGGGV